MSPRILRKMGPGVALNAVRKNASRLGGLIFVAVAIDLFQLFCSFLVVLPFVGLPLAFISPLVFSVIGFVLLGVLGAGQVKFFEGAKSATKLRALALVCFLEAIPIFNLGFAFTFGTISIIRSTREETEEAGSAAGSASGEGSGRARSGKPGGRTFGRLDQAAHPKSKRPVSSKRTGIDALARKAINPAQESGRRRVDGLSRDLTKEEYREPV